MSHLGRRTVLFVSTTLSGGGAERFVSNVLAHLDRDRFAPRLALLRDERAYPLPDDVSVACLDKRRTWHLPRAIARLAALVDAERPDILASAFAHPNLVTGCALALARHTPRWVARVSSPPEATDPAPLRPLMRRLYRRADAVVVNARALALLVERTYGVRGCLHVPNATDFTRADAGAAAGAPPPAAGRRRIVAVGRLAPEKRHDLLIEAVTRLAGDFPIELVICGEGPERGRLAAAGAALPAGVSLALPGFTPNPFGWMASAEIFAASSDVEGLPNALVEAQGLGIPAVSTDCPTGPAEVIENGRTGLLVPTGDAAALAGALRRLLEDAALREQMGRAAREAARRRFAAPAVTRQLEEVLAGPAPR